MPNLALLNKGATPNATTATVNAVSCGAAGQCVAGGYYTDKAGHGLAFVVTEKNSAWQGAREVPGLGHLDKPGADPIGPAQITSVSCASAGNCAAVGGYNGAHGLQTFVVNDKKGTWGTAFETPGIARLSVGNLAQLVSVSCPAAGNCTAAGELVDSSGKFEAFVVDELNGTWRPAIEIPGAGVLNQGGSEAVMSLSCGAPHNCSTGGFYADPASAGRTEAFVASES